MASILGSGQGRNLSPSKQQNKKDASLSTDSIYSMTVCTVYEDKYRVAQYISASMFSVHEEYPSKCSMVHTIMNI